MKILTHNLGFPRIGAKRELKKPLEAYWSGKATEADLLATAKGIRQRNWLLQKEAGIDLIPSNDFSLYDHVLDACALVGLVPERFQSREDFVTLKTYFAMARGLTTGKETGQVEPARALEMTKWFDTNYHYLVPELHSSHLFKLSSTKPFDEFREALALGIRTVPVLVGPLTLLTLGKIRGADFDRLGLLPNLLSIYEQVLRRFQELGAEWVQIDEPILCLDLTVEQRAAFSSAYQQIRKTTPQLKVMVATYFGDLGVNLTTACELPINAIHFDCVRAPNELDKLLGALPLGMMLSVGVVDGRNVWRNDFGNSLELLKRSERAVGADRLLVSPSCSLLHSPLSLKLEATLDSELKTWLAFAEEKLTEVALLASLMSQPGDSAALLENRRAVTDRKNHMRVHNSEVKLRTSQIQAQQFQRKTPFGKRIAKQKSRLQLPVLPTTTIGSFPQTEEIRGARARFKKRELSATEYERFLEDQTRQIVQWQEAADLDVLVHGEAERNDMVEYFGEQLAGIAFTENGWVQSYGSRCVKPPIIYGDVRRLQPMTLRWTSFAQSLTARPLKGMLTSPITILQWSFVRDDQPRSETAYQIALALRDEVSDLETAGIGIIQIDEPALREGLPLRRAEWASYLEWAVNAFRLTTSGVKDETQIHTHMCYCEFNDIMGAIAALDADVISIEASRSNMELLQAFVDFRYPNEIGPGVWDIHSPRIPSVHELRELIEAAAKVIPTERLWVNPDCGLKTRPWAEVIPALTNLVAAARAVRESMKSCTKTSTTK
jgi:5-methyltetrahydropteroyltriglutamate--homocysteine methyltransferase